MASQSRGSTVPTQPFSNPDEFQRRVEEHLAERRAAVAEAALISAVPPTSDALAATTPTDLEIDDVARAFRSASLASLPDARFVLATATSLEGDDDKPAVVRFPHNVGTWDVVGVVQRTHDVDFTICIKFYDLPVPGPIRWGRCIASNLHCRIYYNPANDDCVLQNLSKAVAFTFESATPQYCALLEPFDTFVIAPGLWRISIGGDGCRGQHLIDFLMLHRSFTVFLHKLTTLAGTSNKRPSGPDNSREQEMVSKRRRADDGDVLETIIAPLGTPVSDVMALGSAPKAVDVSNSSDSTTIYTPKPIQTRGTPLLDLEGQDFAIVRTNQFGTTARGKPDSNSSVKDPDLLVLSAP
ncbi:hypothetical protein RB597_003148 [Gaeumannomyces tritici]